MYDKLHAPRPERGWRITVASGFLGLLAVGSLAGGVFLGAKAWHAHEHAARDAHELPFKNDIGMPRHDQLVSMINDTTNPTLSVRAQNVSAELDSTSNYIKRSEDLGIVGGVLLIGAVVSANREST